MNEQSSGMTDEKRAQIRARMSQSIKIHDEMIGRIIRSLYFVDDFYLPALLATVEDLERKTLDKAANELKGVLPDHNRLERPSCTE